MSGRIADLAIDPTNENVWYVAVGSGGVWKTTNAGTTFTPIFDEQPVYSIGCITLDPNNPYTVWVGTGENVGGRHAGFGDGVYRSLDGGASWENRGLKDSEHISKIIVHPDYSALRGVNKAQLQETASLFEPRKAWWYLEKSVLDFDDARGSQGSQLFVAPNPDFGAVLTYYLKDEVKSVEQLRQELEDSVATNVPFPGWEALEEETREMKPYVYLEIQDTAGRVVNG